MARWIYVNGDLRPVTGPPGPGLLWRGSWSDSVEYQIYDIVHHDGNTFIAVNQNLNSEPVEGATPNPDWDIFLQGGAGGGGASGDEDSVYIKSTDETLWRIFINDDGVLETEEVVE